MPTHFNPSRTLVPGVSAFFAALTGFIALAVAYYAQYIEGLQPCALCLWQRIPYGIILPIGIIAFLSRWKYKKFSIFLAWFCLILLIVAAGLGAFHAGVEYGWWEGPASCSGGFEANLTPRELLERILKAPVISCKIPAIRIAGLSMAGWNVIYALVCAFLLFLLLKKTK